MKLRLALSSLYSRVKKFRLMVSMAEGNIHTEYKCTDRRECSAVMCTARDDEVISGCINMTGVLKIRNHKGIRRIYGIQDS